MKVYTKYVCVAILNVDGMRLSLFYNNNVNFPPRFISIQLNSVYFLYDISHQ